MSGRAKRKYSQVDTHAMLRRCNKVGVEWYTNYIRPGIIKTLESKKIDPCVVFTSEVPEKCGRPDMYSSHAAERIQSVIHVQLDKELPSWKVNYPHLDTIYVGEDDESSQITVLVTFHGYEVPIQIPDRVKGIVNCALNDICRKHALGHELHTVDAHMVFESDRPIIEQVIQQHPKLDPLLKQTLRFAIFDLGCEESNMVFYWPKLEHPTQVLSDTDDDRYNNDDDDDDEDSSSSGMSDLV